MHLLPDNDLLLYKYFLLNIFVLYQICIQSMLFSTFVFCVITNTLMDFCWMSPIAQVHSPECRWAIVLICTVLSSMFPSNDKLVIVTFSISFWDSRLSKLLSKRFSFLLSKLLAKSSPKVLFPLFMGLPFRCQDILNKKVSTLNQLQFSC